MSKAKAGEEAAVIAWAIRTFKCDAARVVEGCEDKFLVLGWKRRSEGEWTRNGEPYNFDYLHEQVVANGASWEALRASAREYKRLLDLVDKYGRLGAWMRILTKGKAA